MLDDGQFNFNNLRNTLITYMHELWIFFSIGLLLQSIWILPRYLKPKLRIYALVC